jgi:hypothetical protein
MHVDAIVGASKCGPKVARRGAAILASVVVVCATVLVDPSPPRLDMKLGVTFSPRFAAGSLGLDARATYVTMLEELGVRAVRLPLYWEEVEPAPGIFDFSEVDFYLAEAEARGVTLVVSLGYKQPRWPECYPPHWASELTGDRLQRAILHLLQVELLHTAPTRGIEMWQVENEPFVVFGKCQELVLTPAFIQKEIALIHRLDHRGVLLTDSGEWSTLIPTVATTDVDIGLSVYRDMPMPSLGLTRYPLPAWSYSAKDWFARSVTGVLGHTIVSELQCEPWFEDGALRDVPYEIQRSLFPPEQIIRSNVDYARRIGFPRAYLWGVEWWYWMAAQGNHEYVAEAQRVFAEAARG